VRQSIKLSATEDTVDTEGKICRISPPCPPRPPWWRVSCGIIIAAVLLVACGKRGAPLPPLVRVPAAPADFTVERRGEDVTLQFKVPAANTDGSRPANIERIDVYAFTGPVTVNDEQLVKFGTKVASLPVKAPRNPDAATEGDEPAEEPDLEAEGLDQGAVATLEDPLTAAAFQAVVLPAEKRRDNAISPEAAGASGPLVGPPPRVDSRTYVLVPYNTRGRKGSFSSRHLVPLVRTPETPATPAIAYDETGINVSWPPPPLAARIQPPATGDLLPARYIGMELSNYAYHVYDVSPPATSEAEKTATPQLAKEVRLTGEAVAEPLYHDTRMDWGATRCYTVRTFETIAGLTLQSDAAPPACVTLMDKFAPAAPKELQTVPSEGAIDLIWEPSPEKDIAGYVVLRGMPDGKLDEIKRLSAGETTFTDTVKAGVQYEYAVQAFDTMGNVSPMSNRKGDAAR
jgi:hypothetical protein